MTPNQANDEHKQDLLIQLYLMIAETLICCFGVPFFIFVSWKNGSECWQIFAPLFMAILVVVIYFVVPVVCTAYNVGLWMFTSDQHDSVYSAWTVAFMVI